MPTLLCIRPFVTHSERHEYIQGKPSITAPRKRRFFQLSNDGSTLRWAWNKYILLYYVQVMAGLSTLPSPVLNTCAQKS